MKNKKRVPPIAQRIIRRDRGAIMRIARRIKKHHSTVSRVVNGKKTSDLTRRAVIYEVRRLARIHGELAILLQLEGE